MRTFALATAVTLAALAGTADAADDWRAKYPTLRFGIITAENEADRVKRYKPVIAHFEDQLKVKIEIRDASDYAGVIEAIKARKIEIARFGPASYAKAWEVTGGKVEPIVAELNSDDSFGYRSVVVAKADGPIKAIEDLKGKNFAWADPNSTSGYQYPLFYLKEAGIDPDKFFAKTAFSGSHENSVIAVMNGTFDGAATWWTNEKRSNFQRMADKGMIPQGALRVVWTSPLIPNSPFAVHADLPAALKADVKAALLALPQNKDAWKSLTDGKAGNGFKAVTHADYADVLKINQFNLRQRRGS